MGNNYAVMRTIFSLLVFLSTCHAANSQIKKEFDKFTGDTSFVGTIDAGRVIIIESYKKGSDDVKVFFKCLPEICVEENSKIFFLFVDGARANDISVASVNCKGNFMLSVDKASKIAPFFRDKFIASIRFVGKSNVSDIDIQLSKAEAFKKNFSQLYSLMLNRQ